MMIKTIIYLFFVTQMCCLAEDDNKNFKDEEVDITTAKSIAVKDSPKYVDKTEPQFDNKEGLKELPKEESLPNPDYKDQEQLPKKTEDKLPDNYETDVKSEKPVHNNPGTDPKDFDLGKDYKKVDSKQPNNGKEFDREIPNDPNNNYGDEKDPNLENDKKDPKDSNVKPNYSYGDEKDPNQENDKKDQKDPNVKPNYSNGDEKDEYGEDQKDKKYPNIKPNFGGEGEYGAEPQIPEYKPPGSKNSHQKDVEIANQVVDSLLKLLKGDYRSEFEQIKLDDYQPFNHGRWGSVKLHSGVVTGLTNVERAGNVVVVDEYGNKKLIIGDIAVHDVYADYKMNAKLFNRISINNRELKLWLKKAVLNFKLEADKNLKKLTVNELNLKTFEDFTVKSGRLFWPFNKLTNAIVKSQEHVIKDLIKKEFDKYMGKVVQNIQFDEVFGKLF